MILTPKIALVFASASLMFVGTGCATKRFVRASVAPVDARVGQVESESKQNAADIDQLEKQVSRAEELATGAGQEAKSATELAKQAGTRAGEAGTRANGAYSLAEEGVSKAAANERSIDRMYENLDNYQMLRDENVVFGFDRADLTADAKAKLDAFAGSLAGQKRYVIEVQGFTDPAGNASYNQELSRRRATAVVRYLTLTHNIPLRRIQMLGVGAEQPVADNKTKAGRQQNRRVEVKVYALPDAKAATQSETVAKSF
jgi:OmpA-OmpF porin, OOP family